MPSQNSFESKYTNLDAVRTNYRYLNLNQKEKKMQPYGILSIIFKNH